MFKKLLIGGTAVLFFSALFYLPARSQTTVSLSVSKPAGGQSSSSTDANAIRQQLMADIERRIIAIAIELARLLAGMPPNIQGGAYPALENVDTAAFGQSNSNLITGSGGGNGSRGGGVLTGGSNLPNESGQGGGQTSGGISGLGAGNNNGSSGNQANGTNGSSVGNGVSFSSASAGGGNGGNNPFGGKTTQIDQSTCNCVYFKTTKITMTPAKSGLPETVLYSPLFSKLYAFYNINQTNIYLLGSYVSYAPCMKQKGYYCTSEGSYPLISIVGTSNSGGDSGGGGTNPPPSQPDDHNPPPPPVQATTTPPTEYCNSGGRQGTAFQARGTAYYPANNAMEGGFLDMRWAPLRTLQQYLNGQADYVSVAMDQGVFLYGTELCIPELENKYGRPIRFRVVDTGSAFTGRGTSRIDICVQNQALSYDPTINGPLTLVVMTR